jgi:hypothetical protein
VRGPCVPEAGSVNSTTTEITLELSFDGDCVCGHVRGADGARREFHGWIGLMGVLDALLDRARTAPVLPTPQGGETNVDR